MAFLELTPSNGVNPKWSKKSGLWGLAPHPESYVAHTPSLERPDRALVPLTSFNTISTVEVFMSLERYHFLHSARAF